MKHADAGVDKRPSEAVYAADIISDTQLQKCSLLTRGFWYECLWRMWRDKTDRIDGTTDQFARLFGCTDTEATTSIMELETEKPCDVTNHNGYVTLISRRLQRREKKRREGAKRAADYRERKSNADVTGESDPPSSSPSSSSSTSVQEHFDIFWKEYPKKVGKKDAFKAWKRAKDMPPVNMIVAVVRKQKQSEQWRKDNGQFIPNPATWINQGRWDDELRAPRQGKIAL
jgi:hypothetical protein